MNTIIYAKLTAENFNECTLNSFRRYQEVKQSLRKINDEYIYIDNPFVENWGIDQCKQVANDTVKAVCNGSIAYGAFHNGIVVGFAYLGTEHFGTKNQYMELKMFQVSNELRNNGIGKSIFSLICKDAKKAGAKKLYISAHSSKESQEAYTHLGCVLAEEINQQLAENEHYDIQMEFFL